MQDAFRARARSTGYLVQKGWVRASWLAVSVAASTMVFAAPTWAQVHDPLRGYNFDGDSVGGAPAPEPRGRDFAPDRGAQASGPSYVSPRRLARIASRQGLRLATMPRRHGRSFIAVALNEAGRRVQVMFNAMTGDIVAQRELDPIAVAAAPAAAPKPMKAPDDKGGVSANPTATAAASAATVAAQSTDEVAAAREAATKAAAAEADARKAALARAEETRQAKVKLAEAEAAARKAAQAKAIEERRVAARLAEQRRMEARDAETKRRALATAEARLDQARQVEARASADLKQAEAQLTEARAAVAPAEMAKATEKPAEMAPVAKSDATKTDAAKIESATVEPVKTEAKADPAADAKPEIKAEAKADPAAPETGAEKPAAPSGEVTAAVKETAPDVANEGPDMSPTGSTASSPPAPYIAPTPDEAAAKD